MHTIRRVLISVTDKTGIVDFAGGLHAAGAEIVSTGVSAQPGTAAWALSPRTARQLETLLNRGQKVTIRSIVSVPDARSRSDMAMTRSKVPVANRTATSDAFERGICASRILRAFAQACAETHAAVCGADDAHALGFPAAIRRHRIESNG